MPVDPEDHRGTDDRVGMRDYVDIRIEALNEMSSKRYDSMLSEIKRIDELRVVTKNFIEGQFAGVAKSTETATESLNKRLEGMNEFRQQINEMTIKYINRADVETSLTYIRDRMTLSESSINNCITRPEFNTQHAALGERVTGLEKFSNNMQGRMWVIAAVVVIMEVALRFLGH